MVRLFLVFTYIWREDFTKISKVPGALSNVSGLVRSITWLVSVTINYNIFQLQFTSTLPIFMWKYTLQKKYWWECSLNKLLNLELRKPGPPGRICTLYSWIFS